MKIFPKISYKICILFCLLLVVGCGIDNYIFLHPVDQILHNPSNSEDLITQYFLFRTPNSKNSDNDPVNFKGYEIYYRIYNSKITLNQDVSRISSFAESNSGLIVNWLKDSMKYHRLSCQFYPFFIPVIPSSNVNSDVYIRLSDYDENLKAGIFVGNLNISNSGQQTQQLSPKRGTQEDLGTPLRTEANGTTSPYKENGRYFFDYENIHSSHSDVTFTSPQEDISKWYVQAYVFSYGYDSSYNSIYSSYFPLGHITIISK